MEREIMETVLQEILQELKESKAALSSLQSNMKEQATLLENIVANTKTDDADLEPAMLSEMQLSLINKFIEKSFAALRGDLLSRPFTSTTIKHFSLLPPNFRMEHFPLLINTVMKWVVVLITLIFAIQMIARFAG